MRPYSRMIVNEGSVMIGSQVAKVIATKNDEYPEGTHAIGMPGNTAYFGFLEICQPKPGDVVVISGAAGAVGSLVGQIAKIKGCYVIGFAGHDDKVKWLVEELGFDKAYNYKTADWT